ncbi:hypothetical protein QUA42_23270 [Microcoleus sp. Pol11C2]
MMLKAFKIVKLTNSANVISPIVYAKSAFYGLRIVTEILVSLTKDMICGMEGEVGGGIRSSFLTADVGGLTRMNADK